MQVVVVECSYCAKEFETEDNTVNFEEKLCVVCYEAGYCVEEVAPNVRIYFGYERSEDDYF